MSVNPQAMVDSAEPDPGPQLLGFIVYLCIQRKTGSSVIQFLAPAFLFGIALIAIPVLIHLFNFRRYKRVEFTNVRFLKNVQEQTSRTSRLKHLLVLLSRILAIVMLALAFAQPVIRHASADLVKSGDPVSIFVDNSFSMNAQGAKGALLDRARVRAEELVRSLPVNTPLQLLTADFYAVQQRLINREEFLSELSRIKPSSSSRMVDEVISRQRDAVSAAGFRTGRLFIISDFQKSMLSQERLAADSTFKITLVSLETQSTPNLYIDTCWMASPLVQLNQPSELVVRVVNSGGKDADNITVRLDINGSRRAVSTCAVKSGKFVDLPFGFTIREAGWQGVSVSLSDQSINFDDTYFLSFEVKEKLNVSAVSDRQASTYTKALFGNGSGVNFKSVSRNAIDYSALSTTQLLILETSTGFTSGSTDEFKKYVDAGGILCVFPDSNASDQSNTLFNGLGLPGLGQWTSLSDRTNGVEWNHPLFSDVFERQVSGGKNLDLPVVSATYSLNTSTSAPAEVLLRLESGVPLLVSYSIGDGQVFLFSVPLDAKSSNLPTHPIFAPILYRMALLGARPIANAATIGQSIPVSLQLAAKGDEEVLKLSELGKNDELIPRVRTTGNRIQVDPGDELKNAGLYGLMAGKETKAVLAYNFNRAESALEYFSEDELEAMISTRGLNNWAIMSTGVPDVGKVLKQEQSGTPLWKWAILLSLLFLLIEVVLIRYWKTS